MRGVEVKKTVKVNLRKGDWQLFCDMPGAEGVAQRLNDVLETGFNAGKSRAEVEREMDRVMSNAAEWGAADSEPVNVLWYVLNYLYGRGE